MKSMAFSPYLRLQHPVGEDVADTEDGAANQQAPSVPNRLNQDAGQRCQGPWDMRFSFVYTAKEII